MTGKAPIPPQSLRWNTTFQGELQGPRLAGRLDLGVCLAAFPGDSRSFSLLY